MELPTLIFGILNWIKAHKIYSLSTICEVFSADVCWMLELLDVRWDLGGHFPSQCCDTGLMMMVIMGCKWDCIRSCAHGVFNFVII